MTKYKMKDLKAVYPVLKIDRRISNLIYKRAILASYLVSEAKRMMTWEFESDETARLIIDREIADYDEFLKHRFSAEGFRTRYIVRNRPDLDPDKYLAKREFHVKGNMDKNYKIGNTYVRGIHGNNILKYLRTLSRTEFKDTTKIVLIKNKVFLRKDCLDEVTVALLKLHESVLALSPNPGSSTRYSDDVDAICSIAKHFGVRLKIIDRAKKIVLWNNKKCKLNKLGRPISVTTGEDLYKKEVQRRSREFGKQTFGGAKKLEQSIGGI